MRLEESKKQKKQINNNFIEKIMKSMNQKSLEHKDKLRLVRRKFEEYGKKVEKVLVIFNLHLLIDLFNNVSEQGIMVNLSFNKVQFN